MRRDEHSQIESAGQDSFLDVTTNIVGILIVLVMVVGMRAQNPIVASTSAGSGKVPATEDLEALSRSAAAIEYEANRIVEESQAVDREIAGRSAAREELATIIAAAEKQIADERAKLDSASKEDYDLRRQINESRTIVEHGEAELDEIKSEKPPVQEVTHYPTPISRVVNGHEVHFQLRGGRITYVPLDELLEDAVRDARRAEIELSGKREGIVGPRNGFELHYSVELMRSRDGVFAEEEEWLVPVTAQQGELAAQALSDQSEFRTALAPHRPRETAATLWVYPDSFALYQRLKEELHKMGYATAARPLMEWQWIGASNHGSKSSAQ